ncbi:hypothetical protein GCM10011247_32700 [Pseudomonas plecoglossicida]|nr:hypothetical protein GCM10011247_32700 [Pseudomonas plecoglossicida]
MAATQQLPAIDDHDNPIQWLSPTRTAQPVKQTFPLSVIASAPLDSLAQRLNHNTLFEKPPAHCAGIIRLLIGRR